MEESGTKLHIPLVLKHFVLFPQKLSVCGRVYLYMIQSIYDCSCQWKNQDYCQLSPSCKGWGCRFLSTPIEEIPATIQEKAKLFSRVYREAKQKGVLECPHYRSIFIDEVLANLPKGEVC